MSRIDAEFQSERPDASGSGRLSRRVLSISLCAFVWWALSIAAPLVFGLLFLVDLVRGVRFAGVRTLAFLWWYLSCELAGVIGAFVLWLWKLCRPGLSAQEYEAPHYALQRWWAGMVWWGTSTFFSLNIEVEGAECATEGPYLFLIRHTSVADSLLASVCLGIPHKMELRYVLKRELLWDPCLDVVGHRIPNVFIGRDGDSTRALEQIQSLAEGLGPRKGVLIYPEGTRFTPKKYAKIVDKLAQKAAGGDPEALSFHAYAKGLRHVLPPRPKGVLALREVQPTLDAVFCVHVGFEDIVSLWHLWNGSHIGGTIRVAFWRVAADTIPREPKACIEWLNEEWEKVDAWVEEQVTRSD